ARSGCRRCRAARDRSQAPCRPDPRPRSRLDSVCCSSPSLGIERLKKRASPFVPAEAGTQASRAVIVARLAPRFRAASAGANGVWRELRDTASRTLILENRDHGRLAREPELLPAAHHTLVSILRELGALGEALVVAIVHAGVDQRLRAPWPDLGRVEARIEIGAPGLAQDVDRLRRSRARRHRPQHLV